MPQLKPQLLKVLCPDLHLDVLQALRLFIVCFWNRARRAASCLRFNFLCLHSKAQPHLKNFIPKNSNHLFELLPLSNGLPNRFILSTETSSYFFDGCVFRVFWYDWRPPAVFLRGSLASCFIQVFFFFTSCCLSASWGQHPRCGTAWMPLRFSWLSYWGRFRMSAASLIQWCLLRSYRMSLAFFQFLIRLILGFFLCFSLFWLVCAFKTSPSHILFAVLNDCPVSPLHVVPRDRQGIAYMTWFLVLGCTANCCCFACGCTRILMWYVFMALWMSVNCCRNVFIVITTIIHHVSTQLFS